MDQSPKRWYWIVTDNGKSPFIPKDGIIELDKKAYKRLFGYSNKTRRISNLSIKEGEIILFYQGEYAHAQNQYNGFYYQGVYSKSNLTDTKALIPCEKIAPISIYQLRNFLSNTGFKMPHRQMAIQGKCYPISEEEYNAYIMASQNDYEIGEDDLNVEQDSVNTNSSQDIVTPYRNGRYSTEDCLNRLHNYIHSHETPELLYRAEKNNGSEFIGWRGRANDSSMSYSDIIAEELLKHLAWLNKIPSISSGHPDCRSNSYFPDTKYRQDVHITTDSNREEAYMAKDLITLDRSFIDEQIPLKSSGKMNIDVVRFDKKTSTIQLMELKRPDKQGSTPETLLRCILEAYTYYKSIDADKFKRDFINKVNSDKKLHEELNTLDENQLKIEACILVAEGSKQHRKMLPEDIYYQPKVVELMKTLGVSAYTYDCGNKNTNPDYYPITHYKHL